MLNSRWHFPICNKLVLHRSSKLILELRNILANPIFSLSAIICWQQFPVVILEINCPSIAAVKILLLFCFYWNLRTNLGPLKWVSSLSNVYRYWRGSESWKNAVNIATWCPATRQQHLHLLHGLLQNTAWECDDVVSSNQCKWSWWQSYLRTASLSPRVNYDDWCPVPVAGWLKLNTCNSPSLSSSSLTLIILPGSSWVNPLEILPRVTFSL